MDADGAFLKLLELLERHDHARAEIVRSAYPDLLIDAERRTITPRGPEAWRQVAILTGVMMRVVGEYMNNDDLADELDMFRDHEEEEEVREEVRVRDALSDTTLTIKEPFTLEAVQEFFRENEFPAVTREYAERFRLACVTERLKQPNRFYGVPVKTVLDEVARD